MSILTLMSTQVTTYLPLVLMLRVHEAVHPLAVCVHGMVISYVQGQLALRCTVKT